MQDAQPISDDRRVLAQLLPASHTQACMYTGQEPMIHA
jgi:hypothetical protein